MHNPHSTPQTPSEVRTRLRALGLDLSLTPEPGYYVHWAGRGGGWQMPSLDSALHTGYCMYLSALQHPYGFPPELWS